MWFAQSFMIKERKETRKKAICLSISKNVGRKNTADKTFFCQFIYPINWARINNLFYGKKNYLWRELIVGNYILKRNERKTKFKKINKKKLMLSDLNVYHRN